MAGIFDGSYLGVPVTGIFDTNIFDTFDGITTAIGCPSLATSLITSTSLSTESTLFSFNTSRICD